MGGDSLLSNFFTSMSVQAQLKKKFARGGGGGNKQHHVKVSFISFHLNGRTLRVLFSDLFKS